MQREELSWDLVEKILYLMPPKSVARCRCVCKRWNALLSDLMFINNHLARTRPQFILLSESKFCSVEVNLEGPCIEVHNLPSHIPGYRSSMPMGIDYCDGLLMYSTYMGLAICNPLSGHIEWTGSKGAHRGCNGIGYDNSRADKHYKILRSDCVGQIMKAGVTEFGSNAWKAYKFTCDGCNEVTPYCNVSLNGNFYWVAFDNKSGQNFIQSFDFSLESLEPYCKLPGKNDPDNVGAYLAIFRGDRFSVLEQDINTGGMEVWVTREKIKSGDGEAVEWVKFMNVLVPKCSSIKVSPTVEPNYFIDEKSRSLVLCCFNKEDNACIYIAKGDTIVHEIKINGFGGWIYETRYHTYVPSLVPVPAGEVGENEWDDGFFDNVKKISVGQSDDMGVVFLKFYYSNHKEVVAGDAHGEATHIPDDDLTIDDDDYVESVEGAYTYNHITFLTFGLHKTKTTRQYGVALQHGIPFVLRRGRASKIVKFLQKLFESLYY